MSIFLVVSNYKDGSGYHAKGTFVEGDVDQFQALVSANLISIVDGAKTTEDAAELVAKRNAVEVEEKAAATAAPADTWGPQPDVEPVVAPAQAPAAAPVQDQPKVDGTTLKYKVLKEFEVSDATSKNFGKHEVGSTLEANPAGAAALVADGTLEIIDESANL